MVDFDFNSLLSHRYLYNIWLLCNLEMLLRWVALSFKDYNNYNKKIQSLSHILIYMIFSKTFKLGNIYDFFFLPDFSIPCKQGYNKKRGAALKLNSVVLTKFLTSHTMVAGANLDRSEIRVCCIWYCKISTRVSGRRGVICFIALNFWILLFCWVILEQKWVVRSPEKGHFSIDYKFKVNSFNI